MTKENFNELARALLCMQNALLGIVTPTLRAVTVDIDVDKKKLFFSFFYDEEISDELFDLASTACAEASANFPHYTLVDEIKQIKHPQEMPFRGRYAYLRKE